MFFDKTVSYLSLALSHDLLTMPLPFSYCHFCAIDNTLSYSAPTPCLELLFLKLLFWRLPNMTDDGQPGAIVGHLTAGESAAELVGLDPR